ncbi:MAG TPA: family 10 glycosylhydrolase, partial [Vicinamibacterales bacterium]|nr:family 10 glycosylhydrolase [Vicinamibacterales bacterium]
ARLDAAARRDPRAWTRYLPESWEGFRRDRLTELVEEIVTAAAAARPGLTMSAAVVPDAALAREQKAQDWAAWARDGLLDVVCPMVYTTDADLFARQVASVRDTVGDVAVWAGVGAYRLTAAQTVSHVRLARRSGATGVALFSYDSLVSARDRGARYFSVLRPALLEDDSVLTAR